MIIEDEKQESAIDLKDCATKCVEEGSSCNNNECKHWMNFSEDNNCDLIAIMKYGPLTLRQVGERLGVSYVRIKQIEDIAINKIKKTTRLDILQD